MIPQFPDFKRIEVSDQREIEVYVRKFPPYSDFNFTSLLCYGEAGEFKVAFLHGNLIVRMHDYITSKPFYTFLGCTDVSDTFKALLDKCVTEGIEPTLKLIPECNFKEFRTELSLTFDISEDEDGFDYIYSTSEVRDLAGGALRRKRKEMNCFTRGCPELRFRVIDPKEPVMQAEIRQLLGLWQTGKERDDQDVEIEFSAISRCLDLQRGLGLISAGLFTGQTLIGFAVFEAIQNSFCMCHFLKADPSSKYKGAWSFLLWESIRLMNTSGHSHTNLQQDLGIPGLRRSKLAWRPTTFLKKYTIKLHNDHKTSS